MRALRAFSSLLTRGLFVIHAGWVRREAVIQQHGTVWAKEGSAGEVLEAAASAASRRITRSSPYDRRHWLPAHSSLTGC